LIKLKLKILKNSPLITSLLQPSLSLTKELLVMLLLSGFHAAQAAHAL